MARSLHNKDNVVAPDSDYPYGRIRDKIEGLQSGTPINEEVYGDFHQFFARLMANVAIEENGQPDNDYVGFQLHKALIKTIRKVMGYNATTTDDLEEAVSTNLNNFLYPGVFDINLYSHSGVPVAIDHDAQIIVSGNAGVTITQRIVDLENGFQWVRFYSSSVFTSWTRITKDWQIIPLNTGWLSGSVTPKYRIVDGIVYLRGQLDGSESATANVNSSLLPAPSAAVQIFAFVNGADTNINYRIDISTSGQMSISSQSGMNTANHTVSLDGLFYHTDTVQ